MLTAKNSVDNNIAINGNPVSNNFLKNNDKTSKIKVLLFIGIACGLLFLSYIIYEQKDLGALIKENHFEDKVIGLNVLLSLIIIVLYGSNFKISNNKFSLIWILSCLVLFIVVFYKIMQEDWQHPPQSTSEFLNKFMTIPRDYGIYFLFLAIFVFLIFYLILPMQSLKTFILQFAVVLFISSIANLVLKNYDLLKKDTNLMIDSKPLSILQKQKMIIDLCNFVCFGMALYPINFLKILVIKSILDIGIALWAVKYFLFITADFWKAKNMHVPSVMPSLPSNLNPKIEIKL